MSKGQRGNREAKKPKQAKPDEKKLPAAPPVAPVIGRRPPGAG